MVQNTDVTDALLDNVFSGLEIKNEIHLQSAAELLDKFGLRWKVDKLPLLLPTGEATGFYGIVRSDTKKVFTTCKDSYIPYQNSELAELLLRITEKTGYDIHSGGVFNDGGKVYLQLNTGNKIKNLGENKTEVKGFITGINSHDGTTSLRWGAITYTICCKNTFASAAYDLKQYARHTVSIHERVDQSIREINQVSLKEQSIFNQFKRWTNIPASQIDIKNTVKRVTGVDITLPEEDMKEKYSSYSINRSGELVNSISKEMNQKGDTIWGLFSGVTHYTTHVMPTPKRDNGQLESKYIGTGFKYDNIIYDDLLMEFA